MPSAARFLSGVVPCAFVLGGLACSGDESNEAAGAAATSAATTSTMGTGGVGPTGSGGATNGSGASTGTSSGGGGSTGVGGSWPDIDYCNACGMSEKTGTLALPAIKEASGIVASLAHPGSFYVHNDSGDTPRFFAVDITGADQGTWNVTGAKANDWEDIARGPCASGTCVFLGDIGNNANSPTKPYAIYSVPEPNAVGQAPSSVAADALPFAYPSGYPNAETLLVHPVTGVITIVTKVASGMASVFEFPMPLTPGQKATLIEVGSLTPSVGDKTYTGGDVHPGGLGVLLRTYTHAFFFPMTPDQSVADALKGTPCLVPMPGGGEAIGWLDDAKGYVGVPEGASAPISRVMCDGS